MTTNQDVTFTGSRGQTLSGVLNLPSAPARAFAVFAHCFTCGKDSFAAARISRGLADRGIGVLRFDFSGLGESGGDHSQSTFSCDVADLVQAAEFLGQQYEAPALLVGHSLGGAAVLAAARDITSVRAVATIGAPSEPNHVLHLLGSATDQIERDGEADVTIGQRSFRIRKAFLDDLGAQPQRQRLEGLNSALLVMHAPRDEIVGIDNARLIFDAARHPKSFVALDNADHLLSDRADSVFAADIISSWAARYLGTAPAGEDAPAESWQPGEVIVRSIPPGPYTQQISASGHRLLADEPRSVGGADAGPNPYDLLLASLGTCTAMTLRMYADRKGLPLTHVDVVLRHERIHATDCADCETQTGTVDHIDREITVRGDLDQDQVDSLMRIADRCPVHRSMTGEFHITTVRTT